MANSFIECVIKAKWTSNRRNEEHAVFVAANGKGGFELIPFEGGSKLLRGAAQICGYQHTIENGAEVETWELAFDGSEVQGFVLKLEDLEGAPNKAALIQRVRQLSMQMVPLRSMFDHAPLGVLPMHPLHRISDADILALVKRIQRNTSPAEAALRRAA